MIRNLIVKNILKTTLTNSGSTIISTLLEPSYIKKGRRHRYGKKNKTSTDNLSKLLTKTSTNRKKVKVKKVTADELKKWHDLLEVGAITKEEYDKKKKELL